MELLTQFEMENINGGKLNSLSDWLLLGSGICFCFCAPAIGVPATIAIAALSQNKNILGKVVLKMI